MTRNSMLAATLVVLGALSVALASDDATVADPAHYTVELDNEAVRVIRVKYGPGESSVMHTHGRNMAVFLTDGTVRMTMPDGTSGEESVEAGATQWADAEEHLPQNIGDSPLELVLIEIK